MKAIINGKIILENEIIEGYALLFSDKIEGVVKTDKLPLDCEIVDAQGGFVSPGLIDLHIHGYLGYDVCDATEDALYNISNGLLANGVTAFLPTTMTVDMSTIRKCLKLCKDLSQRSNDWDGSIILGCHTEGPFINKDKKGAQNPNFILPPDADFVKEFSDVIKMITLAPECDSENFSAIKDISKNTNIIVSIGHTTADYKTAKAGINAGAQHITHLFNAMSALTHREPGVVGAALNSDVSCELIVDNIHINPALYDIVWKLKGRKLCFITDCLSAGGLNHGEYTLGGSKIIYKDNICQLEDGTIAGSVLKLNEGVWNAYKNSNIPLYECVNCASLNPATVLSIDNKKGSIKIGKDADIIVTDNNFNVLKTIICGKIKYQK